MKNRIAMALLVMASIAITLVVAPAPADAQQQVGTYRVTLTNTTDGQYLTPPNFAGHSRRVAVFDRGEVASPGLQAVAENGGVPVLAEELNALIDQRGLGVSGVGADAPIAPGETVVFEFTTEKNFLTVISMIICTNDGFGAVEGQRLPRDVGQSKEFRLRDFDAGTEINTESLADIVPAPFCQNGSGLGTGQSNPALAENGVITRHPSITGEGDLGGPRGDFDWRRGSVGSVVVERVG